MKSIEMVEKMRAELIALVNQKCDDAIAMFQTGRCDENPEIEIKCFELGWGNPRGCRGREHAGAESKGQYTTCDGAAFGRTGTVDGSPQISRGYPSHCADYGWQIQL